MKPVLNFHHPVGVACLLLCLALSACNGEKQPPAADADSQTALRREGSLVLVPLQSPVLAQLKLAEATLEQVQTLISAPATIEAEPEKLVKITPPVAGRLVRLHRQLGDPVKAGEALITMDSSDISVARADNAKAQSALLLARQEFDRQKLLFDAEIAARKDYDANHAKWQVPLQVRAEYLVLSQAALAKEVRSALERAQRQTEEEKP